MRPGYVWAVVTKEARDLLANRLLLLAVVFPALVFASIPTGIVAFIEYNELDPDQIGQIEQYISQFPDLSVKRAAQAFIVLNFMAYFLLIPAMVPMAIATQSVIGEKTARSLEPQLATPMEVTELLIGKALAAATPAVVATWAVFIGYGLVNGIIAVAVAGFFSGQASFTMGQVLMGNLVVGGLIGVSIAVGSWIFDREQILT